MRRLAPALLAATILVTGCTDATGGDPTEEPTDTQATTPGGADPTAAGDTTPTAPPTEGDVDLFEVTVGTCLTSATISGSADTVELVPCTSPHRAEAYAATELPHPDYPGEDAVGTAAELFCYDEFEPFVGLPLESSVHDFVFLAPTPESWEETEDREVLCLAVSPEPRSESLRGATE